MKNKVNYKLKSKILAAGLTQGKLAEVIGITNQAMSNKITGKNDFTQSEISEILSILKERGLEVTYEDIF